MYLGVPESYLQFALARQAERAGVDTIAVADWLNVRATNRAGRDFVDGSGFWQARYTQAAYANTPAPRAGDIGWKDAFIAQACRSARFRTVDLCTRLGIKVTEVSRHVAGAVAINLLGSANAIASIFSGFGPIYGALHGALFAVMPPLVLGTLAIQYLPQNRPTTHAVLAGTVTALTAGSAACGAVAGACMFPWVLLASIPVIFASTATMPILTSCEAFHIAKELVRDKRVWVYANDCRRSVLYGNLRRGRPGGQH